MESLGIVPWVGSALLLLSAGLVVLWVMIHRSLKKWKKQRMVKFREMITASMIRHLVDDRDRPGTSGQRLLKLAGTHHRQEVIDLLFDVTTQVRGTTAQRVRSFYVSSGLVDDSLRKLKKRDQYSLIMGMRELAAMEFKEGLNAILPLLIHKNRTVRTEAYIATLQLADDPLFFMDHVRNFVLWEQINVLAALKKRSVKSIPQVGKWLSSRDFSVVRFCLTVISEFGQRDSLNDVHALLKAKDVKRVVGALKTLHVLQDQRSQRPVRELAEQTTNKLVRKLALELLHELSGPVQWLAISRELRPQPNMRLAG